MVMDDKPWPFETVFEKRLENDKDICMVVLTALSEESLING